MDSLFRHDPLTSGVKGLVFVGDKIVVYRRDNNTTTYPGYIDLPGGGSEDEETVFETFKREVYEEINLTINSTNIVYLRRYPSSIHKGKFGYFVVAKLPKQVTTQIKLGDEGTDYRLLTIDEYLELDDAWPVFQDRTRDYIGSLSSLPTVSK